MFMSGHYLSLHFLLTMLKSEISEARLQKAVPFQVPNSIVSEVLREFMLLDPENRLKSHLNHNPAKWLGILHSGECNSVLVYIPPFCPESHVMAHSTYSATQKILTVI